MIAKVIGHKLRSAGICQVEHLTRGAPVLALAYDDTKPDRVGGDVSDRIGGFAALIGLPEIVQTAVDHLHREVGEGPVEYFGDRVGQVHQHDIEYLGRPHPTFDAVLGANP